eukprot:TRINITY_DN5535_c0_g3_i1.p1 TRINITY_DN5535_c0_g3~~TRINITY_DN5535_c0_g3_i1.p1  ORF type:complete len:510 (-),score=90.61 TRINITY_DN5535_c0_g3_i1:20-1549(-)
MARMAQEYSNQDLQRMLRGITDPLEVQKLTAFYQGRVEVASRPYGNPVAMSLNDNLLAYSAVGGHREQELGFCMQTFPSSGPYLSRQAPPEPYKDKELKFVNPGFSSSGDHIYADPEHNMVWCAGDSRIKGFDTSPSERGKLRHTLWVGSTPGPMMVVGNDLMVVTPGEGKILVWHIHKLTLHAKPIIIKYDGSDDEDNDEVTDGSAPALGGSLDKSHIYLDEGDKVEISRGERHHKVINISYPIFRWSKYYGTVPPHVKAHFPPSVPLSSSSSSSASSSSSSSLLEPTYLVLQKSDDYSIYLVNVDDFQTPIIVGLGCNAFITCLYTCPLLQDAIVTTAVDGYLRIHNINKPLPITVIEAGGEDKQLTSCCASVFGGGDDVFIITGHAKGILQVWDIQNRKCLYYLSVGNGVIRHVSFHCGSQTLVVGSEGCSVDRLGFEHDMKKKDALDGKRVKWPRSALLDPTFFGVPFHSSHHALTFFRYAYHTCIILAFHYICFFISFLSNILT